MAVTFHFTNNLASGGGFSGAKTAPDGMTIGEFIRSEIPHMGWDKLTVKFYPEDPTALPVDATQDMLLADRIILSAVASKLDGGGLFESFRAAATLGRLISKDPNALHDLESLAGVGKLVRGNSAFVDDVMAGIAFLSKLRETASLADTHSEPPAPPPALAIVEPEVAAKRSMLCVGDPAGEPIGRIFVKTFDGDTPVTIFEGATPKDVLAAFVPAGAPADQYRIELNQRPAANDTLLRDDDVVLIAPLALVASQLRKGAACVSL